MRMKKIFLFVAPLLLFAGCQAGVEKVPAIDLADLDLSCTPGQNFYQYANGGWMASHPLPAEFSRYGSFDALGEKNVERLNDLFAQMTTMNPKYGTTDQKIVDLYKQGLDSTRLNEEGAAPLKANLEKIYSVADKSGLAACLADLNRIGEGGFFGMYVTSDMMNSDSQILYFGQSGLGMGDRDYYMNPANHELHEGYRAMLTRLFTLCGFEDAAVRADNALAMEDALAAVSWTRVQLRDVAATYNPMTSAQFFQTYPGFDFSGFCSLLGIPEQEKIVVEQPSYFEGLSRIMAESELNVIKDYLAAQYINGAAGSLSDDFYTAEFDFFSRQMRGITDQKPRWKRAMSVPNSILGEAVGQMYVKKYFPASYKKKMLEIVHNLQASLGEHIDSLEWMTDSTKAYAREKLAAFTVKIGYPDKWKDYSSLSIDPEKSYLENIEAASAWYVADNLGRLGKPTDRDEWFMSPQTVNAYYNPTTNEICFPAAILQPPFFNANADDAVNYGAIGVVIGHEMTHGFDDQGRLFDKVGNMNNWWSEADAEAFKARTAKLAEQFNKIEVLPGIFANGDLSLGENIADQGGLRVAYTAFRNSLGGKEPAPVDGMTADQRFYIGYAHVWAGNITDEEKARRTQMDEHSLSINRVNASLKNIDTFFDAFGIKEGDEMWRPESERVIIW